MKKPWRFTPKQVRKDKKSYYGYHSALKFHCRYFIQKVKTKNDQQLWLERNEWVDNGIYQKPPTKQALHWDFW